MFFKNFSRRSSYASSAWSSFCGADFFVERGVRFADLRCPRVELAG